MNEFQILERLSHVAEACRYAPDARPDILMSILEDRTPETLYYRFLYDVSVEFKPRFMVETGTWHGISAAHLAVGNPESTVMTFDIDPEGKNRLERLGIRNVLPVVLDASCKEAVDGVRMMDRGIDLLFLDSEHRLDVVEREWNAYWPLLKPGGIVLLDDIQLNPEMRSFWSGIAAAKEDLSFLHLTHKAGFGACVKHT